MRKVKRKALFKAALAIFAVAAVFVLVFMSACSTSGRSTYEMESDTHVDRYDITYDITSDRRISATERIEIYFDGDPAFERLLEISNGEMVRNLKAVELVEGTDGEELEQEVEYQVASTRYHDFAVEIGGETNKYGTHTYLLTYDYCLTRADNNYTLTFRAFEKKQEFVSDKTSVSITCYLPDGYQNDAASYLVSDDESEEFAEWTQNEVDGRTVISTSFSDYEEGMDFVIRMTFRDGSGSGTLTKFRDRSPLWFAVAAAGLIVITLILKFTVFRGGRRKNAMGLEAMKRMDPMLMGKFADNRVGKEDISSLVMYWANMGYLKMDLTDPDDPVLVRTVHLLPETEREYEKYLFYNLFKEGKRIKLSSLKNKYYVLADAAAEHVNETTRGLYNTASIVVSLIITLIGIVLLGIAPLVVAQIQVSSAVTYYMSFIVIIPALIIYAVMETLVYNSFKSGRVMNGCLIAAVIVMCALTVIAYVFLIPSYIVGNLSKEVISEAFCILFIVAPLLICKSRKYSSELDDITSFKAAIKKSTPDDIEGWYAADPQLYYKIMPYARVMGLAQYWEDKNQGMPIPPADWAILPASLGDNPAFEQAEPLQRKASEQLYSVLSSRPAPREEERKKEEHEKHDEGRKGAE